MKWQTTRVPTQEPGDDEDSTKKDVERSSATPQDETERGNWSGRLDFVMSALSFAVGMGNIWRFPYMCYRNGGGAFLIPYVIMTAFAGIPMMFLELAFGQYGSLGVVSIWRASPLFQGIGWTMFAVSFVSSIYYNMLIAYSLFYMIASFASDVPWRHCDNWWNSAACGLNETAQCFRANGSWHNGNCYQADPQDGALNTTVSVPIVQPRSPADEYFHNYMLDISSGLDDMGMIRWQLALCLFTCWVVVVVCLSRGIKSSGKATYITAVFPYIIMLILLVQGLTLSGSANGIKYYITPQWHRLLSAKVWGDAAIQVFFSMSCCWGGLVTLASYNKFNNNCLRDAFIVSIGDFLTSIFGGFIIFAIIGYMAHELGVPVDAVATQGAGLAFIVYPSAVARLPVSPLWAILFMLMLINMGIGTQFTLVTTVQTTLLDVFHKHLRKGHRPLILLIVISTFCFFAGLSLTTRGGMYVLQLMDTFAPSYALLVIGLAETLVLSWVYGVRRLLKEIQDMIGFYPGVFWVICWKFVTPALISAILLFTFIDFKRSSYGHYIFPVWADLIGWSISMLEIAFIPGVAIYQIYKSRKTGMSLIQRIKSLARSSELWGPAIEMQRRGQAREMLRMPLTEKSANGNSIVNGTANLNDNSTVNGNSNDIIA